MLTGSSDICVSCCIVSRPEAAPFRDSESKKPPRDTLPALLGARVLPFVVLVRLSDPIDIALITRALEKSHRDEVAGRKVGLLLDGLSLGRNAATSHRVHLSWPFETISSYSSANTQASYSKRTSFRKCCALSPTAQPTRICGDCSITSKRKASPFAGRADAMVCRRRCLQRY